MCDRHRCSSRPRSPSLAKRLVASAREQLLQQNPSKAEGEDEEEESKGQPQPRASKPASVRQFAMEQVARTVIVLMNKEARGDHVQQGAFHCMTFRSKIMSEGEG